MVDAKVSFSYGWGPKMPIQINNALTAARVKQEKKPGRYADGNGLYLHVSETGARWWIWRGTVHGRRRELGMGAVLLIPLAEAREIARTWRRIARDGGDPVVERDKNKRKTLTFETAARKVWADQIAQSGRNEKYVKRWFATLRDYAFPVVGSLPVHTIRQSDVLRVLSPIWAEKPKTAQMVRQRLRTVLNWARTAGHFEGVNPVDGIEDGLPKQRHRTQHRKALPFADLPDLMRRLEVVEGVPALALRFLILTAARSGEVRGATWSEIDEETRLWAIPQERMKADHGHRVPLSGAALAVLDKARGLDQKMIFPARMRGAIMHDMTIAAPLKRLDVSGTVHGLRSSFRDWAAERTSVPREIAEMCLAHEVGGVVERAYRRSDLFDKRRDLMARWSRFCSSTGADVIEIGGRG
jgi:integrase